MNRLTWLGWGLELVAMVFVLVPMSASRNWLGITAVFWILLVHTNRANLLAAQIEQINSRLGFGVSMPITEMPKVMEQIESRLRQSNEVKAEHNTANTPVLDTSDPEVFKPKSKRRKRSLLDELTALENETQRLM